MSERNERHHLQPNQRTVSHETKRIGCYRQRQMIQDSTWRKARGGWSGCKRAQRARLCSVHGACSYRIIDPLIVSGLAALDTTKKWAEQLHHLQGWVAVWKLRCALSMRRHRKNYALVETVVSTSQQAARLWPARSDCAKRGLLGHYHQQLQACALHLSTERQWLERRGKTHS